MTGTWAWCMKTLVYFVLSRVLPAYSSANNHKRVTLCTVLLEHNVLAGLNLTTYDFGSVKLNYTSKLV